MKRSLVFIDGNAFRHFLAGYKVPDEEFDFSGFAAHLVKRYGGGTEELIRAYYYAALPVKEFGTTEEEKKRTKELMERKDAIIRRIQESGRMAVRLGHTQVLVSESGQPVFHEKGVDVRIVSDITRFTFVGNYEVFYLLTADNDIAYALEGAKEGGKVVKWVNIAAGRETGRLVLAKECDEQIRLLAADVTPFRIKGSAGRGAGTQVSSAPSVPSVATKLPSRGGALPRRSSAAPNRGRYA